MILGPFLRTLNLTLFNQQIVIQPRWEPTNIYGSHTELFTSTRQLLEGNLKKNVLQDTLATQNLYFQAPSSSTNNDSTCISNIYAKKWEKGGPGRIQGEPRRIDPSCQTLTISELR